MPAELGTLDSRLDTVTSEMKRNIGARDLAVSCRTRLGVDRQDGHRLCGNQQWQGVIHRTSCLTTGIPPDENAPPHRLEPTSIGNNQNRSAGR